MHNVCKWFCTYRVTFNSNEKDPGFSLALLHYNNAPVYDFKNGLTGKSFLECSFVYITSNLKPSIAPDPSSLTPRVLIPKDFVSRCLWLKAADGLCKSQRPPSALTAMQGGDPDRRGWTPGIWILPQNGEAVNLPRTWKNLLWDADISGLKRMKVVAF